MEVVLHRLRDQHAVERVAQRTGQGARPLAVLDRHREGLKALAGDAAEDVGGDASASGSLPMRALVAISQAVAALTDTCRRIGGRWRPWPAPLSIRVAGEPPEKCVRVEQQPQRLAALPELQLVLGQAAPRSSGPMLARPFIEPKPRLGCSGW